MELVVTRKLRLYPMPDEAAAFLKTQGAVKLALNHVSRHVFKTRDLSYLKLEKLLYDELRADFGLKSQMAQSVIKTVVAKYKAERSNGHPWCLVRFKRPELDLVFGRDWSFRQGFVSVNTLSGRIIVAYSADIEGFVAEGAFGTAKLLYKKGKFRLHVPVTTEVEESEVINRVVGVDMGVNFTAVAYDGEKTLFFDGRQIKNKRGSFVRTRKELQRKGTPSARRRLKAIGQRERRYMADVNHKVSKALVEFSGSGSLIVVEDLTGVRNATDRVRVKNRYVSVSWAFYQLRKHIEYKAVRAGVVVAACDPRHTSQTCPKCGHVCRGNRDKKNHVFKCKRCGYSSNDDRAAAMNLRDKGIKYLGGASARARLLRAGGQSMLPDATTRRFAGAKRREVSAVRTAGQLQALEFNSGVI